MAVDYKQYNYPNTPYANESVATAGCGPCSVSDIVEVDPTITAKWLTDNGYAYPHQGTKYPGIAACLTAYNGGGEMLAQYQDGVLDNVYFREWKRRIQSGQEGILLMHKVTSSYWTSGGHYIAIVGFSNSRYLVYDPASVVRTGWHLWGDFSQNVSALYTSTRRWNSGKVVVDGVWGKATTTLAQKIFGTTVDGIVSDQNKDMQKFLPACQPSSWEFVSPLKITSGSQLVKAIQEMLGMRIIDGVFGYDTAKALQQFLGVTVDGYFGYNSVVAWQKWLNRQ